MEKFYCEVLGYEIVWRPSNNDVYLSAAGDNLALHCSDQITGSGPLDHLGMMVPSREQVDAWDAHLRQHHVLVAEPPRDHRDGSRSLYCHDPEGNVVQLIWIPAEMQR